LQITFVDPGCLDIQLSNSNDRIEDKPPLGADEKERRAYTPGCLQCGLAHASHYVAGFGQDLKGEVLESAVKGDLRLSFGLFSSGGREQ
jgi:hypothetical protein